ncbi:hypothetical protein BDN72DRAFT_579068 [Pluteus cervinus]|uniref:Uncharacterized protein n=1 Tax=Pluteus cervinus TaxID=181527 RepID=A0ACD3AY67_9AGAR|nr:hypothetical protein BDN72DRAFT_579068 [Pluteus cervinus]
MSRCSPVGGTRASYPEGPPETAFERVVHALDKENFKAEPYAYMDALIAFSLFSTKRRPNGDRALALENTSDSDHVGITKEEGVVIAHMCATSIPKDKPTRQSCHETASGIQEKLPHVFGETDIEIMIHLLLRYFLLYSEESPVGIQKIVKIADNGVQTICAGLKAKKQIPALTYLLSANGSLSSDGVGSGGLAVDSQPSANRKFIRGPLHFVNHDCQPNCEVPFSLLILFLLCSPFQPRFAQSRIRERAH